MPSNGNLISFGVELYKVFMKKLKGSFDRWDAAATKAESMHRLVDIENEYMEGDGVFVCAESVTADVINDICVGDRLQFRGDVGEWGMALSAECVVTNLRGSTEFTSQEVDFVFTDDEGNMWSGKLGMVDDRARVKVRRVGRPCLVYPCYCGSGDSLISIGSDFYQLLQAVVPGTVVRFVDTRGHDIDNDNFAGEHVILSVHKDENGVADTAIFVTLGIDNMMLGVITKKDVTLKVLLPL